MAMLVMMRHGSTEAERAAVRALAGAAGLAVEPFASNGRTALGLAGEAPDGLRDKLAAAPGVEAVLEAGESVPPRTRDLRIASIRPLVPPAILLEELPLPGAGAETVQGAREAISAILSGADSCW
jgi:3-deoxy-7-phosphoheptulonate synthase